jgi:Domain of Unknown Function (DUF1206)
MGGFVLLSACLSGVDGRRNVCDERIAKQCIFRDFRPEMGSFRDSREHVHRAVGSRQWAVDRALHATLPTAPPCLLSTAYCLLPCLLTGTIRSTHGLVIERLARLGYASIGIVYMIVGGFAVAAALGKRGSTGGHEDAFRFIREQPFGRVLLVVIAIGLVGYVLWRFASAFSDSEHRGSDVKGLGIRIASVFRGLVYSVIAFEVMRMVAGKGGGGSGGEQQADHWTSRLMQQPFGRWLVALAGLGVVAYGAYQLYAAWDAKLSKRIRLGEMDSRVRNKVVAISRFGIGARGVVFFIVGGSLVLAAVRHNPETAHSTTGAMQELPQPLLVAVGLGLAAYGVYALVNARYRRIKA